MGRFDWQEGLCDGDQYFLTLNISHKYLETEGNVGVIHIRLTEGAYVVGDQITLYTVPRSNEEQGGNAEGSGDTSTLMFAGIGALLLIAVLGVTMMFMRGRGGSDQQDSVESFGGVEQMDPVEAYVQQLVAQGYDEQMARQYATQYYAQYYDQQNKGGGG